MNKQKERLIQLLETGKINETDFKNLSSALAPEERRFGWTSWLFNPFERIDGTKALAIGSIGMLLMSLIGALKQIHYPGVLDLQISHTVTGYSNKFGILVYQNFIAVICLGAVYYMAARLLKQKNLRLIDFFGMVALSRLAYLPATVLLGQLKISYEVPTEIPAATLAYLSIISIPSAFWIFTLYFNALKEASGLTGKKLWVTFFITVFVAEIISFPLARYF